MVTSRQCKGFSLINLFYCKSSRAGNHEVIIIFLCFQLRLCICSAIGFPVTEVAFILTQFLLGLDHS